MASMMNRISAVMNTSGAVVPGGSSSSGTTAGSNGSHTAMPVATPVPAVARKTATVLTPARRNGAAAASGPATNALNASNSAAAAQANPAASPAGLTPPSGAAAAGVLPFVHTRGKATKNKNHATEHMPTGFHTVLTGAHRVQEASCEISNTGHKQNLGAVADLHRALEAKVKQLQEAYQGLTQAKAKHQEEMAKLRTEHAKRYDDLSTTLSAKIRATLEGEAKQFAQFHDQCMEANKEETQAYQGKIIALEHTVSKLQNQLSKANLEHTHTVGELFTQHTTTRVQLEAVGALLKKHGNDPQTSRELKRIQANLDHLTEELKQERGATATLRQKLNNARTNAAKHQEELQQKWLDAKKAAEARYAAGFLEGCKNTDKVTRALAAIQQQRAELTAEKKELEKATNKWRARATEQERKSDELQQQVNHVKAQHAKLEQQKAAAEKAANDAAKEAKEALIKRQKLDAEIQGMQQALDTNKNLAESTRQLLEKRVADMTAELDATRAAEAAVRSREQAAAQEKLKLQASLAQESARLKQAHEELHDTRKEVDGLQQALGDAELRANECRQRIQTKTAELEAQRMTLHTLQQDKATAVSQVQSLHAKVAVQADRLQRVPALKRRLSEITKVANEMDANMSDVQVKRARLRLVKSLTAHAGAERDGALAVEEEDEDADAAM